MSWFKTAGGGRINGHRVIKTQPVTAHGSRERSLHLWTDSPYAFDLFGEEIERFEAWLDAQEDMQPKPRTIVVNARLLLNSNTIIALERVEETGGWWLTVQNRGEIAVTYSEAAKVWQDLTGEPMAAEDMRPQTEASEASVA